MMMTFYRILLCAMVALALEGVGRGQTPGVIDFREGDPEPVADAVSLTEPPVAAPTYPTAELGGVLQLDTGWFSQDSDNIWLVGPAENGTSFRTARLWGRGQLSENVGYMLEMDFGSLGSTIPGRPNFQNAFLELQDLPWLGTARAGRWKQPFSLETATSIRFLTFIERASLFAFVPFRRTGVGFFDATPDERWTYAASVFRNSDDGYGGSLSPEGNNVATAARLTHLLRYENGGADMIHLGLAHAFNTSQNGLVRFARFGEFAVSQTPVGAVPSASPNQFDTGPIASSHFNLLGSELAWVRGPFSIQGEGVLNFVDRTDAPTAVFTGWYIYGSWFLTGEHRDYIPAAGAFDRVTPHNEFSFTRSGGFRGTGAWELATRLSQIDVNGGGVNGGALTSWTVGLNWHLNPNAKLQFNYIHNLRTSDPDPASRYDVYALRMAYDF